MKILIGCEESGIIREEFKKLGHNAWSCDLLDTILLGQHLKADILDVLFNDDVSFYKVPKKWDLLIAHPPCTRLCNSGVRWLNERNLWDTMRKAALFFKRLLYANIPRKAIENPIPHKYALEIIGRKYDQLIQPYMFGHGETKATCLWLHNLPLLKPTNIVKGREARIHKMPPSEERSKLRSRTYVGIAKAMAKQWGKLT